MTSRILVVSDLHLAVPGPLNNFHAGDALAAFVGDNARPGVTLVLAGDAFDFLQIDGRLPTLHGPQMPALIQATLDAVDQTAWGRRLFQALGALLESGGRCVILPGNHDPEVAHPAFAQALLQKANRPADDPALTIHASGPWRATAGAREVVVGHGHRFDPWNDIPPANVDAALQGESPSLPPGSRLVTDVLNQFKTARDQYGALRFPFVDLLKPEVPAVPLLLLYLDRALAMQHLPRALGLYAENLANALAKALLGTATLSASLSPEHASPAPPASPADDIARALARTYTATQRQNPGRCATELEDWLNGEGEGMRAGTLAAHGGVRPRILRAFLHLASDDGRFFTRSHKSDDCLAIAREHLRPGSPPRVVIAGHTHAAREIWLSEDHAFINTGTWTDLMELPSRVDDDVLKAWIDRLERRDVPRVRQLTFAEVTPESVALRDYPAA